MPAHEKRVAYQHVWREQQGSQAVDAEDMLLLDRQLSIALSCTQANVFELLCINIQ